MQKVSAIGLLIYQFARENRKAKKARAVMELCGSVVDLFWSIFSLSEFCLCLEASALNRLSLWTVNEIEMS